MAGLRYGEGLKSGGPRTRFSLTQEAFEALLGRLDESRDRAGEKFELLRGKLLRFFTYERCAQPERWADEALDQVAKRLAEGHEIEEVNAFARGVAKMVLHRARLVERNEQQTIEPPRDESREHAELDAACLDRCLRRLRPESRALIEAYYLGPSAGSAQARKELAEKLGISGEALRSRALRVRGQLQSCLAACREMQGAGGTIREFSTDQDEDDAG